MATRADRHQRYVEQKTATPELAEAWRLYNRERQKRWYRENLQRARERWRRSNARRQMLHPEANRLACRRYAAAHREQSRKQARLWRLTHPEEYRLLHRRGQARRNARKAGAYIESISYEAVMLRDQGICGLCSRRVPLAELTFDHIVPLSLGGDHTELNLQVAHRVCNTRRGAAWRPAQMRLGLEV